MAKKSFPTPRTPMSQEARARIAQAAKDMHARRKAAKEAGSKAAELRALADVVDQATKLSPASKALLKSML